MPVNEVWLHYTARFLPMPSFRLSPDPAITVTRHGPGWRFPQDGWIVAHIEGSTLRGQVINTAGWLGSAEIVELPPRRFPKFAAIRLPTRRGRICGCSSTLLFLRRIDQEYLKEMQGIRRRCGRCRSQTGWTAARPGRHRRHQRRYRSRDIWNPRWRPPRRASIEVRISRSTQVRHRGELHRDRCSAFM